MVWCRTWKNIIPAAALGLAFTASMPTASAFFPPIPPPGETVTVVPPIPDPIVVPPIKPVPPICRPPEQPVNTPGCGCGNPGTPQSVPEPATMIAAFSGLATLAGWRLRKRK